MRIYEKDKAQKTNPRYSIMKLEKDTLRGCSMHQTQNELQYFIGDTKLKLLYKNLVYKNNKE